MTARASRSCPETVPPWRQAKAGREPGVQPERASMYDDQGDPECVLPTGMESQRPLDWTGLGIQEIPNASQTTDQGRIGRSV